MDTMSQTDSFCILYEIKTNGGKKMLQQLGRTECIFDSPNPKFVTNINVEFYFETTQHFQIDIYDMDDNTQPNNLKLQEYIGKVEFTMHSVVTARDQSFKTKIQNPAKS